MFVLYSTPSTLTWVLVLSSELFGDVLFLQVLDPLLFLLQPAETASPECWVFLHQTLNSDLRGIVALLRAAAFILRRLTSFSVHLIVLETSQIKEGYKVKIPKQVPCVSIPEQV